MPGKALSTLAKGSLVYGVILSHPFAAYAHTFPVMENDILLHTEQLSYQEQGKSVKILQKKLNKLSYYEHAIDGKYGVFTEHAIKQFQRDNFLYVTGQADLKTIQAIIVRDIEHHMSQLQTLSHKVYLGMHSQEVIILQRSLQFFGYYTGELDGIYGPLTESALKTVEKEHEVTLIENHPEAVLTPLYEAEKTKVVQVAKSKEKDKESKEEEEPQIVEAKSSRTEDIINTAQSLIGTPYTWGGTTPQGFDCSGFIQYVYQSNQQTVPRTVSDMWNFSQQVNSPSVGDLVFFETYQAGPSHMGIYIGDGQFIHAGTSTGVTTAQLHADYWQDKYLGARRVSF